MTRPSLFDEEWGVDPSADTGDYPHSGQVQPDAEEADPSIAEPETYPIGAFFDGDKWAILTGDCVEKLRLIEDKSVDAVVTDPPYGLEFMGKEWDTFKQAPRRVKGTGGTQAPFAHHAVPLTAERGLAFQLWCEQWARECLRVLKPGGYLLAFGGTRTYHREACAIEDAGFEIRDSLHWIYGSGFPKSLDVSKAIDKAAGVEREVVGIHTRHGGGKLKSDSMAGELGTASELPLTAPATPDAARWSGYGTALKPAHEPIILARKPLAAKTVAANVLEYGTGGINIDGCRIGTDGGAKRGPDDLGEHRNNNAVLGKGLDLSNAAPKVPGLGRWPPNILLTHSPDCVPTGETRKVRGSRIDKPAEPTPSDSDTDYGKMGGARPARGHGDENNEEAVEVYACVEGCPVAEMDRQSGITSEKPRTLNRNGARQMDGWGLAVPSQGVVYGDSGGASRFFPVFEWDDFAREVGFRYRAKAGKKERPSIWIQSCKCEDACPITSPVRDTDAATSTDGLSTTRSGSVRTDRSQEGIRSITGTETSSTTFPVTSDCSRQLSISESTQDVNCETASGGNPVMSADGSSRSLESTGISLLRDGRSTDAAAYVISESWSETSVCVSCGAPARRESHATVKPLALMRWLVRLVTPPKGIVLDPFAGTGTTAEAAVLEDFYCLLIERDEPYVRLTEERMRKYTCQLVSPIEEGTDDSTTDD